MSVDSFSKGIVEIISSSKDAERVENEILQVFNALSKSSEALDVFRNFGIPVDKKIEAVNSLLDKRVLPLTLDLITLTISQGFGDNLSDIESSVANYIAEKRGASVAKVVSAVELDAKTEKSLISALIVLFRFNISVLKVTICFFSNGHNLNFVIQIFIFSFSYLSKF